MSLFTKVGRGVDVGPLNAQIAAQPELWDQVPDRRLGEGSPHSEMRDIWIRQNDIEAVRRGGDMRRFNEPHVPIWYPAWHALPALRPIVFHMAAAFQAEMIGGILITRIPPGCGIKPHQDHGWHVDYYDKFYLSLEAGPGAEFVADAEDGTGPEVSCPAVGEVYHFDNRVTHWVTNSGPHTRTTLIVCLRTDLMK